MCDVTLQRLLRRADAFQKRPGRRPGEICRLYGGRAGKRSAPRRCRDRLAPAEEGSFAARDGLVTAASAECPRAGDGCACRPARVVRNEMMVSREALGRVAEPFQRRRNVPE